MAAHDDGWLSGRIAEAARELEDQDDLQATLDEAARLAVANVDGCDAAGISMVRARKKVETAASTSRMVADGDRLQYETGEGPCLDAIWEDHTVHSPDLRHDPRWPIWGPRVADETGAASVLAFRLYTRADDLGALNLYSRTGFDDADRELGLALAAHTAIAVAAARQAEQLTSALDTRTVIGQATGMLMERLGVEAHVGFSILTRISQESNTKLHDVAASVVATRRVPPARRDGATRGARPAPPR